MRSATEYGAFTSTEDLPYRHFRFPFHNDNIRFRTPDSLTETMQQMEHFNRGYPASPPHLGKIYDSHLRAADFMKLSQYNNTSFDRGAPRGKEALWWVVRSLLFAPWFPIPSSIKVAAAADLISTPSAIIAPVPQPRRWYSKRPDSSNSSPSRATECEVN
jgi:hypothetical protein